jgi:uncharacterized membrane protein
MSDKDKKSKVQASKKDIEEGKSLAWLSYLGLLLLIPLLVKPDNSFCKHHAKQGLVMLLCWIGLVIVSFIPFLNIIAILGYIGLVVLAIIGIVQSLSGNYWKAPLRIYELAQKFNI